VPGCKHFVWNRHKIPTALITSVFSPHRPSIMRPRAVPTPCAWFMSTVKQTDYMHLAFQPPSL